MDRLMVLLDELRQSVDRVADALECEPMIVNNTISPHPAQAISKSFQHTPARGI